MQSASSSEAFTLLVFEVPSIRIPTPSTLNLSFPPIGSDVDALFSNWHHFSRLILFNFLKSKNKK